MSINPPVDVRTAYTAQQKGVLIVDVRESFEFEAGHADGAMSVPMTELNERHLEIPKDQEVLLICKSGGRSSQACQLLGKANYNVTNISGGSIEWLSEQLPFVSENGEMPQVI